MRASLMLSSVLLSVLATACSANRYGVEVSLPDGVMASTVEVRLVPRCSDENEVLAASVIRPGAMAMELGAVPPGSYGVYALVYDENCRVIAEGCMMVTAAPGGGMVQVPTQAVDRPRECRASDLCMCTPFVPDAGMFDANFPDVYAPDAETCLDCDGRGGCEDTLTDREHCGECDRRCAMGLSCTNGVCGG